MKVRFKQASWRSVGGLCASLLLLVSFQNCGKAGFDSDMDSSLDTGLSDAELSAKYGETTAAKVSATPFAFDVSFDTITYNSCADSHLRNNAAFFSLKAGAYASGGVKINSAYFDYADANFKPIYPATSLSEAQYKEYLADSPANNGAAPVAAVRVKNSLTDVYSESSTVTLWKDVIPMASTLTDPLLLDSYIQNGVTANYFPFSSESRVLESTMTFNTSESLANEYRNVFMGAGVLTVGFSEKDGEIFQLRAPSSTTPVRTAYGKGYSLTFSKVAVSGASTTNPNNVVSGINEYDLQSPATTITAWNCSRKYAVVRAQDASSLCPAQTYGDVANNSATRSELEVVRRHLRADQWDVNVARRCVVPKGGVSCYKEESVNGAPVVEYDLTKECFRENGYYAGTPPNSRCLHWVTICTRY